MAEDMIARTANAIFHRWNTLPNCPGDMYSSEARRLARAALLAALDPEDEALVAAIAKHMHEAECAEMNANPKMMPVDPIESIYEDDHGNPLPPWAGHEDEARAAIAALKAMAQGENVTDRKAP